MTDRFEEAVRQAAQGLGDGAGGDLPGYHGAWQRGRRRRMIKQGGMAFAGALVLVAALTINLGSLGRGTTTETDDVAVGPQAATSVPTTAVPTTEPVTTPAVALSEPAATTAVTPAPTDVPSEPTVVPDEVDPVEAPTAGPTTTPAEPTAAPTVGPTPLPTATSEPAAAAVIEAPTPTPTAGVVTTRPAATSTPQVAASTDPSQTNSEDDPDRPTAETGPAATEPAALPNITFIGPNQKPDATVLTDSAETDKGLCDLDGDKVVDATCKLLSTYACIGDADVKAGYLAVDLDEDGAIDTCAATETTTCDTSGDGFADTACTIELLPESPPVDDS